MPDTVQSGFHLWDDAYDQYHQFLCDSKKVAHYQRWRVSEQRDVPGPLWGMRMKLDWWSPWHKIEKPHRMDKAWYRRKMTVEDLILGNYEKEE